MTLRGFRESPMRPMEELRVESREQKALVSIANIDRITGWCAMGAVAAGYAWNHTHHLLLGGLSLAFSLTLALLFLAGTFIWGLLWRAERTSESERKSVRWQGLFVSVLIAAAFSYVVFGVRHGLEARDVRSLGIIVAFFYGPYSLGRIVGCLKNRGVCGGRVA